MKEIWKDIVNLEGLYQVSNERRKKYQKILSINSRKIKGKKSQRCFPVVIFTLF